MQPLLYFRFLWQELISPVNYLMASLIGITINHFQGLGLFGSLVPFVVPVLVQTVSKATVKYQNRELNLLAQLPGRRPYPAFVLDKHGKLAAHAGLTRALFQEKGIGSAEDLFGDQLDALLAYTRLEEQFHGTLKLPGLQDCYDVQAEYIDNCFLVWLSPATAEPIEIGGHLLSPSDMPS